MNKAKISLRVSVHHWKRPDRRAELLELLKKYSDTVTEVAFFTGLTHPPLPIETIHEHAAIIKDIIPDFKALGLSVGINHLATIGHVYENLKHSLSEPWQRIVGSDGKIDLGCFCPADSNHKAYTKEAYTSLAKTGASFIWLDDDVRMDNHGIARFGCFCDNCLEIFSRSNGSTWDRESLVKAFELGTLSERLALRKQWIEHNRYMIDTLCSEIKAAISAVDPKISVGLMSADASYHGYAYERWANTLAGDGQANVMWRPGGGFYIDSTPEDMLVKCNAIGKQNAGMPDFVTDIQSEIENFPYHVLKKSATMVGLECAAYIAAGCTGAALNICGTMADPLDEYERFFGEVKNLKGFLDKETAAFGRSANEGIGMALSNDCSASANPEAPWLDGPSWPDWQAPLNELFQTGIPIAYSPKASSVQVLKGDNALAYSQDELKEILAGGVLCDVPALVRLNEMGMGKYTGFEAGEKLEDDVVEKLNSHNLNGDYVGWMRDGRLSFKWWAIPAYLVKATDPKAQYTSEAFDFGDDLYGPTSGVFENELGGRIAVRGHYPWTFLESTSEFMRMRRLLRWLSSDTLPCYVDSFHKLAIWKRTDANGKPAMLVMNNCLDKAKNVRLAIKGAPQKLTLTRTDLAVEPLKTVSNDGQYGYYEIDTLQPWEMALITAE